MKTEHIRYSKDKDLQEILTWMEEQLENEAKETGLPKNLIGSFYHNKDRIEKSHNQRTLIVYIDPQTDKAIAYQSEGLNLTGILEVREDKRGQGIGRALVEYRIKEALDNNNYLLIIQCKPTTSVPFWEDMGFQILKENSARFYAYKLLERKNVLPQDGVDVSVKVCIYNKEVIDNRYGCLPIKVFTPRAVQTLDGIVHLEKRISFFDDIKFISESNDLVIEINVNGEEIYFGKAKYNNNYCVDKDYNAEKFGVRRYENYGEYAYYLDFVSKQDRTIAHHQEFGIVLV